MHCYVQIKTSGQENAPRSYDIDEFNVIKIILIALAIIQHVHWLLRNAARRRQAGCDMQVEAKRELPTLGLGGHGRFH
jgi:hypothetical protein